MIITIEGIDGAGKGTQTQLLFTYLRSIGREIKAFDFPRYGNPSARNVERYLNGEFGTPADVGPQLGSWYFAEDRKAAAPEIRDAVNRGKIVICNRYVGSNLAHQGGKIAGKAARHAFFRWNDRLEYEVNGIPKPDVNPVLFIPPEASRELVLQKQATERGHLHEKQLDAHEADIGHLQQTYETYRELVELFPDRYLAVECFEDGRHLPPLEIHAKIWNAVKSTLGY